MSVTTPSLTDTPTSFGRTRASYFISASTSLWISSSVPVSVIVAVVMRVSPFVSCVSLHPYVRNEITAKLLSSIAITK